MICDVTGGLIRIHRARHRHGAAPASAARRGCAPVGEVFRRLGVVDIALGHRG